MQEEGIPGEQKAVADKERRGLHGSAGRDGHEPLPGVPVLRSQRPFIAARSPSARPLEAGQA